MIINIKPPVYIVGVKRFWKPSWQQFFGYLKPQFVAKPSQVPSGASALIWGVQTPTSAFNKNVTLYRVEDGFLRSVGLGAEFARPCSWVVDSRGMYFDATQPSDLEHQLQHGKFTQDDKQRADALIQQLNTSGVNKYNTGNNHWQRPTTDKRIILVPGQVESDASIQLGSPAVKTNIGLLEQVRTQNPDAYIIYKPHPDVVAGARAAGQGEERAKQLCDDYVTSASINQVFAAAEEVHTLTSLSGFEALVRGKKVHCYGQPFYSGWGLTEDHNPQPRRTRQLALNELVAATLIHYPMYRLANSGSKEVTPEQVIKCLQKQRQQQTSITAKTLALPSQMLKKSARKLLNLWR
ncbi:beta-3-deoxy-D-manno-oct-2-ulosonic acid transferase [Idiomarina ramblicola]|uniref:Beta-3-deoxy-D-manno-oct-2-ulosonic acid transferase n=1 Tax=Idiomarina ramblicola TaxID=263724 RepID=A0A432Z1Q4_9GAMM|nr:beta-3-deoxy-D-manno-oct-2-ulosonic acid transferase [Idiomarina ramblicola]RUO71795.1 beta-3-deoxy-D-manno-oct-2-ulosonic acid transferase [Idiomarina ramblicola]